LHGLTKHLRASCVVKGFGKGFISMISLQDRSIEKQITRIDKGTKIKENITLSERVKNDDLPEVSRLFSSWWRDKN